MHQFANATISCNSNACASEKCTVMLKFSDRIGYAGRDGPDRAIWKSVTSACADAITATSI